jgi:acyl-CoA synthetase (AMP-forming)/AMP-acid ligase II/alkylation response protein AidB-like acyl-CoA dehydrogenase
MLDARASMSPFGIAYTCLRDGEAVSSTLTFGALRQRSLVVAARLASQGVSGHRAILLYPHGTEFVVAFFGCLYAGVMPVPASTPTRKKGIDSLRRIVTDSGARYILSPRGGIDEVAGDIAADGAMRGVACLDPEEGDGDAPVAGWVPPLIDPGGIALLQYTSGTTGVPRGVAVTHANLVDNHRQMRESFDHDESTVIVSWLPMFHDMGLGALLMTVWSGAHCVIMSPGSFIQSPRRWLAAITQYRGTTSLAPDFAYDLCARRVGRAERAGLDLSHWRAAVNGSEPVRASTIERFAQAFGPCGFRRTAFQPGYGLAEATLFVTSGHPSEAPVVRHFSVDALAQGRVEPMPASSRGGRALVSCGRAWSGTSVIIVGAETRLECGPGVIGEIWVRGASVTAGYWGHEIDSGETFQAKTADDGRGPFLRTGDLGFIDHGHLYVTGRIKDLVIIRGRSHSPQDIEDIASASHPALVQHACAAFLVAGAQGEQLVIVQELARSGLRTLDMAGVLRAIRRAVSDGLALHADAVLLVKPLTLPRTSSGKLRRQVCRQAYLHGSLLALASWVAASTPASAADEDIDSERRKVSARADQLIEWLRRNAAELMSSSAIDGRRTVSPRVLGDFARQGLLGMQVEPQHGGLGFGHLDTARVIEQLAAFDFALAVFIGLNHYLGIQPVATHLGPELRALLLPGLAQGKELAAFAFEEPGGGKLPHTLNARATKHGADEWLLAGTKYLDCVMPGASTLNVFVHQDGEPGMTAFVIPVGTAGVRRIDEGLVMGVLGFSRETIVLDGVRVGPEHVLGAPGAGINIAREAMMHARLAIGAACVGGMKRCIKLVSRAGPYGGIIQGSKTPNPVMLARLGTVMARVAALECLVHRTAEAIDAGHDLPPEAFAALKILGPELLLRSIDDLVKLGIGGGLAESNSMLSLYRDAGLLRVFDGAPETVAELTGAAFMKTDASLRLLVDKVFRAPEATQWIGQVREAVQQRMGTLSGPPASRAQRWGHTRAGELTTWVALLGAVEASQRASPSAVLGRAHAWAQVQFEQALASVRSGSPVEITTIDASEVASMFAAYAREIGEFELDQRGFEGGASMT